MVPVWDPAANQDRWMHERGPLLRRSASRLALLIAICACTRGSGSGSGNMAAARPDERGKRVVESLRPALEVLGRPVPPRPIADRMARLHVPGVSFAIADGGRLVWAQGVGLATAGSADSVTPATLFQAQSISKVVAATATLRLVEQGVLELDADVNRYLTTWKVPENRFTARDKVTLRRILSHSAGLTVHGFPSYAPGEKVPTLLQVMDGTPPATNQPVRVDTFPGAVARYSGGGTTVAQLVLTQVTGEDFPQLARRLVFAPAGMTSSSFELPLPPQLQRRAARGHFATGSAMPTGWNLGPWMAAGGLWTTPTDLVRWALAIDAAYIGERAAILSRESATQMLTVQKDRYGLGPEIEGSGRTLRFGHGGSNMGFRAQVVYFPATRQGAAVMVNGDGGDFLIDEVTRAIAAEFDWPALGPLRVTAVALDSTSLRTLLGEYALRFPGAREPAPLRVSGENGRIYFTAPPLIVHDEVVPTSSAELVSVELGYRVKVDRDPSERVTRLTLTYGSNTMSATPGR
jgi:CubicO group peptidase (beta-lactamase class C family)